MATLKIPYKTGWYPAFLAALSVRANIAEACETAGITKRVAYLARKDDAQFAEDWEVAIDQAVTKLKVKLWQWAEEGNRPDKRALAERIVARYDPQWRVPTSPLAGVSVNVSPRGDVNVTALVGDVAKILEDHGEPFDPLAPELVHPLPAGEPIELLPTVTQSQNGKSPAS